MNDSERYINNSISFNGKGIGTPTNTPSQYQDKKRQYLANRTKTFTDKRAYLATDYVEADCQGIEPNDFYKYVRTTIRLADISSASANTNKRQDDFKEVLFDKFGIEYFPIGAKIETMGNTWLSINPSNISSVNATSVVARCNTSYNSYDFYGNIVTEPIVLEKYDMSNNNSYGYKNLELMEGYFDVTCQANDVTRQLGENKRIILGSKPYRITGFTDFIQEFSGDRDSCHILNFTVRVDEPNINDDMLNYVADGKSETFGAKVIGDTKLIAGQLSTVSAIFIKNCKEVEPSSEYPVEFTFTSSDSNVAEVDDNGNITTHNSGTATITAVLRQNNTISATLELQVEDVIATPYVAFNGVIPKCVVQYCKETLSASYYESGLETQEPLTWDFSGVDKSHYSYKILEGGKSVEIECITPSARHLTVKASYGAIYKEIDIDLVGY